MPEPAAERLNPRVAHVEGGRLADLLEHRIERLTRLRLAQLRR